MTYRVSMEVSVNQIEELIEQLPIKDQIRLMRKLEGKARPNQDKQTISKKLHDTAAKVAVRNTLKRIDERKRRSLGVKEILQEIRNYRKAKNGQSRH